MVISESELIEKLRDGDRNTYVRLFKENYKNLVLYAKKFVLDTEIARDLVQDVFIYLWDRRRQLNIERSIDSYLYRAVHNASVNHLKRESTKANYIKQFLLNLNGDTYATSTSEDVYEITVHNDLLTRIESIIESLPEQCRNIFRMSRFKGLKNKEIAEIYSISPRTVETQIYRALKVLKEKLSPHFTYGIGLLLLFYKYV
jgi:RNA polymerase sigma-70 factor (ECF subfamily)